MIELLWCQRIAGLILKYFVTRRNTPTIITGKTINGEASLLYRLQILSVELTHIGIELAGISKFQHVL